MQQEEFWRRVDAAASVYDDLDDRIRALTVQLGDSPDQEIAGFRDQLQACLAQAARSDIYAAGVLLTGRTFDEERFEAFTCMLILKGRQSYEAVLHNPDAMADLDFTQSEKELDFEPDMLLYAPDFAYQDRHGEDADLDAAHPAATIEVAPITFRFDKDTLMREFPRLWPKRRAMVEPKAMDL